MKKSRPVHPKSHDVRAEEIKKYFLTRSPKQKTHGGGRAATIRVKPRSRSIASIRGLKEDDLPFVQLVSYVPERRKQIPSTTIK